MQPLTKNWRASSKCIQSKIRCGGVAFLGPEVVPGIILNFYPIQAESLCLIYTFFIGRFCMNYIDWISKWMWSSNTAVASPSWLHSWVVFLILEHVIYAKNDFALSYPVEHSVLPQATPGTLWSCPFCKPLTCVWGSTTPAMLIQWSFFSTWRCKTLALYTVFFAYFSSKIRFFSLPPSRICGFVEVAFPSAWLHVSSRKFMTGANLEEDLLRNRCRGHQRGQHWGRGGFSTGFTVSAKHVELPMGLGSFVSVRYMNKCSTYFF